MRLDSVQIQRFRCIDDSTEFKIKSLTCLVGKNESGKTAILKALHRLKPESDSAEKYKPSEDHPKKSWLPGQPIAPNPPIISTKWELEPKDIALLDEKFGKGAFESNAVAITKSYDNQPIVSIPFNEKTIAHHLLSRAGLTDDATIPAASRDTIAGLTKYLSELAAEQKTENHNLLQAALDETYKGGPAGAVTKAIFDLVPTFLYFDQYHRVQGQVAIQQLIERRSANTLTTNDRIFLALLELAGATPEEIKGSTTFEEFNSKLRAVSNQISDKVFEYWSQNRHLDVMIKFDQGKASDPAPFNSGEICRVRIDNRRHRSDTSFDDRSSGFVWFFSFLVWFDHIKRHNENIIILLDEPGLSLHARAQSDLLRYFKEKLSLHQVIYTTHSPFMIDADNILDCRTVEDVVKKQKDGKDEIDIPLGTKVGSDVLSTDEDTISPLQRVLDYELTQTLFIGKHTLLVEGPSDFLYLKWFSRQLEKASRTGLDYRWNICQIGGIDRIPGFISLFKGNNLNVAALVDVHDKQKQRIENARKALKANHLLTTDTYAKQKQADIEDILGYEFYAALVNKAYDLHGPTLLATNRAAGDDRRAIEIVEAHFRTLPAHVPEFDHYYPADVLFQTNDEGAGLPGYAATLNVFEQLFKDVNGLIK